MTDSEIGSPFSVVKPPLSRGGEGSPLNESLPVFDEGYGAAPTGEPSSPFTCVLSSRLIPAVRPAASHKKTLPIQGPEQRAMFRARWNEAKIAADDLEMALNRLWELRATRDIDWKTILNHVQGMIKQLFAAKRVESLAEDQCESILEIVVNYLGPATKTIDDLNEVLRLIEDIGCDP